MSKTKDPRFKPVAIRSPRGARTTEIYPHAILRGYCPCATCQGHSGEVRLVETRDDQLELEDITPVGGYALGLKWFDGHDSGIYSYAYLRSLCQCPQCKEQV